jgi:hypothetical protein
MDNRTQPNGQSPADMLTPLGFQSGQQGMYFCLPHQQNFIGQSLISGDLALMKLGF